MAWPPGLAIAAAVIGFVDAASVLIIAVFELAVVLLGSLALLRDAGRTLFVVGAVVQVAVAVVILVAVGDDPFDSADSDREVVIGPWR